MFGAILFAGTPFAGALATVGQPGTSDGYTTATATSSGGPRRTT